MTGGMLSGKWYTSTLTRWVWRPVRCEQCGCEFAYRFQVEATGTSYSPLFLNNPGAQESAQNHARKNFDRRAKKNIAAINCPQCNHLQKNMVRFLKTKR